MTTLVAVLAGCETVKESSPVYSVLGQGTVSTLNTDAVEPAPTTNPDVSGTQVPERRDFYSPGSGRFVKSPRAPKAVPSAGDVTLNFENTNLIEVVRVVLGDLIGENYVLDPRVQGAVTLQTSTPLARKDLLPTLEMLLRMNGAALVDRGNAFHVVPIDEAPRGGLTAQLGGSGAPLPRGYGVRIVPLRFVSAAQMQQILEPIAPAGSVLRVDRDRNLMVLAGSGAELRGLLETIELFDVDWLEGTSVALITPDYVDAKTLAEELKGVFPQDGDGPLAGIVRLTPIERLNALLVITARPEYLRRVRSWVERLDQDTGSAGQRLFVYRVKNGKAAEVAAVLSQVYDVEASSLAPPAEVAPGLEAVSLLGDEQGEEGGEAPESPRAPTLSTPSGTGLSLDTGGKPVKVIADEVNNALVILATPAQYRQIETALKDLDSVPLQVLVEVTIAEISLENELQFGLEWFFKNNFGRYTGAARNEFSNVLAGAAGFSYAITGPGGVADVRAVLNALATDQKLNVVSSPSLMVLNNQTATIQVGDEVPITTQQQQATDGDSNVINNIERRDTGVLLQVTPRVNPGGLVTMEVEQEVSDVVANAADALNPTISTRKVTSTVAVQSGQTVVLGGLIREDVDEGQSGLPILSRLPGVGPLFGSTSERAERTELVILITPRAVSNSREAAEITNEYRKRMEALRPFEEAAQRLLDREAREAADAAAAREADEAAKEAAAGA